MQIGCRGTMRTAWPLLLVATALLSTSAARARRTCRFPAVFNFGDSNSDTGGVAAAGGIRIMPPEGRTYFHHPTGRLSDGRVIIDFICEFPLPIQFNTAPAAGKINKQIISPPRALALLAE